MVSAPNIHLLGVERKSQRSSEDRREARLHDSSDASDPVDHKNLSRDVIRCTMWLCISPHIPKQVLGENFCDAHKAKRKFTSSLRHEQFTGSSLRYSMSKLPMQLNDSTLPSGWPDRDEDDMAWLYLVDASALQLSCWHGICAAREHPKALPLKYLTPLIDNPSPEIFGTTSR